MKYNLLTGSHQIGTSWSI